jgi:hypothetical protein
MARHTRHTGTGAIDIDLAPDTGFQLVEFRIHLSAGGAAGNLILSVDSGAGAEYDAVLVTEAMVGVADYVYLPTMPRQFGKGDELNISYAANAAGTTYGIEIVWAPVQ